MEDRKNKKKKRLFDRILDYTAIKDGDHDYLFDDEYIGDESSRYDGKSKSYNDLVKHYDDEKWIDKLIMGELLDFDDIEQLMERSIHEFKRTFSAPNKNIEIIFREFQGKDIDNVYEDKSEDTKDKDIKSKDGDEDER